MSKIPDIFKFERDYDVSLSNLKEMLMCHDIHQISDFVELLSYSGPFTKDNSIIDSVTQAPLCWVSELALRILSSERKMDLKSVLYAKTAIVFLLIRSHIDDQEQKIQDVISLFENAPTIRDSSVSLQDVGVLGGCDDSTMVQQFESSLPIEIENLEDLIIQNIKREDVAFAIKEIEDQIGSEYSEWIKFVFEISKLDEEETEEEIHHSGNDTQDDTQDD